MNVTNPFFCHKYVGSSFFRKLEATYQTTRHHVPPYCDRQINSVRTCSACFRIHMTLYIRCRHFEQSSAVRIVQFLNLEMQLYLKNETLTVLKCGQGNPIGGGGGAALLGGISIRWLICIFVQVKKWAQLSITWNGTCSAIWYEEGNTTCNGKLGLYRSFSNVIVMKVSTKETI